MWHDNKADKSRDLRVVRPCMIFEGLKKNKRELKSSVITSLVYIDGGGRITYRAFA
jgi:hypothetical protein